MTEICYFVEQKTSLMGNAFCLYLQKKEDLKTSLSRPCYRILTKPNSNKLYLFHAQPALLRNGFFKPPPRSTALCAFDLKTKQFSYKKEDNVCVFDTREPYFEDEVLVFFSLNQRFSIKRTKTGFVALCWEKQIMTLENQKLTILNGVEMLEFIILAIVVADLQKQKERFIFTVLLSVFCTFYLFFALLN